MSRSDVTVDLEYLLSLEDSFKQLVNVSAAAEAMCNYLDAFGIGDTVTQDLSIKLRDALEKK